MDYPNNVLIEFVQERKGGRLQSVGTFVGILLDGTNVIRTGWSRCRIGVDKFNKEQGVAFACKNILIPAPAPCGRNFAKKYEIFQERCTRYFKGAFLKPVTPIKFKEIKQGDSFRILGNPVAAPKHFVPNPYDVLGGLYAELLLGDLMAQAFRVPVVTGEQKQKQKQPIYDGKPAVKKMKCMGCQKEKDCFPDPIKDEVKQEKASTATPPVAQGSVATDSQGNPKPPAPRKTQK